MGLMGLMRVGVKLFVVGCKNKGLLSHTFSRHGKVETRFTLLIWLNEKAFFTI